MPAELDARGFEARYRELLNDLRVRGGNDRCVECTGCHGCSGSTFCRDSERLTRCHYCVECRLCIDCSHCHGSTGLVSCHHCMDCESCVGSSYLMRCAAMAGSTYCFGCVGLSDKDFYILNEPYERSEYFAITRRLLHDLRR